MNRTASNKYEIWTRGQVLQSKPSQARQCTFKWSFEALHWLWPSIAAVNWAISMQRHISYSQPMWTMPSDSNYDSYIMVSLSLILYTGSRLKYWYAVQRLVSSIKRKSSRNVLLDAEYSVSFQPLLKLQLTLAGG